MRMWPDTTNSSIEPPKSRKMPSRPSKNRRKRKDEPKKFGKISKKGVKMTCSICKQIGHNKTVCPTKHGMRRTAPSNDSQRNSSQPRDTQTRYTMGGSVCGDTTVPRDTQTGFTMGGPSHSTARTTYTTTQSSQPSSVCGDTTAVLRAPQKRVQVGSEEDWGEKKLMQEGLHLLVKEMLVLVKCHLYQVTRDHTILLHLLLLLEETEGLQLVLVYTLILQLNPSI